MEDSTNFTHHHHSHDDDEYYAATHGYSSNQQPTYVEASSSAPNQWNPSFSALLNINGSNNYYHKYDSEQKNINPPAYQTNLTKFAETSPFPTHLMSTTAQNPNTTPTRRATQNNWLSSCTRTSTSTTTTTTTTSNSRGGLVMQLPAKEEPYERLPSDTLAASLTMYNNSFLCHNTSSILNQLGLSSPSNSLQQGSAVHDLLGANMYGSHQQQQVMYGAEAGNNTSSGKDSMSWCYGAMDHFHDSSGTASSSSNNSNRSTSAFSTGVTGTKRPNIHSQPSKSSTAKRSPLKTSFPPFKVRKEKLGDRIAALHQMVSPFGKTDTASVLTEAIGYIQFLQDQIQTLCMPNVKPSRNKTVSNEEDDKEEAKQNLMKRRGLCLVPLSWTTFITPHDQLDTPNHHFF